MNAQRDMPDFGLEKKEKKEYWESLTLLSENDFLEKGEPDPEFSHILHYDDRMFDYITKSIGLIRDSAKFIDTYHHGNISEPEYNKIIEMLKRQMKAFKNPNLEELKHARI